MHLLDAFNTRRTTFSFEFFPPRSESASADLLEHIREFEKLKPTFVSVTYGAGGSTRQITHDLVVKLRSTTALDPMPHLTCVGHSGEEIDAILERYAQAGINKLLALRGDVPRDTPAGVNIYKDLRQAADLVARVRRFNESGRHPERRGFTIGVAGYPEGHAETPNRMLEIERLKAKVDQGAHFIITQLFFDNRDFYDFRDRCELAGIRVPIIAGIMPITSLQGMKKMAELAAGSRYPAPLIRAVNRAGGNDESVRRVGTHWATEQCRDLLDHRAAGIHFYTLNKSTATRDVYATLGVQDSLGLL
ncbi:MAG: methylenetetrahydrofolate reductase [NAD(P)H] [Phycisphaerales bacterium]|jgi:methylenetetrahydrofolate reductase (NADPH)|nr:methylenetetrahydrofolate reductase [NAD(P)H] [Phycisphaerales bacterium]